MTERQARRTGVKSALANWTGESCTQSIKQCVSQVQNRVSSTHYNVYFKNLGMFLLPSQVCNTVLWRGSQSSRAHSLHCIALSVRKGLLPSLSNGQIRRESRTDHQRGVLPKRQLWFGQMSCCPMSLRNYFFSLLRILSYSSSI